MTFEQIQEVLTNGVTSGPEVGVCNGINALTTATQKTATTGEAEDLSGLVASVKDASDTTHAVYLTSIDASFLAIVAIAGIMGIQIHNNLKTENPELWAELNNFRQSRYFKTFIGSKDEIASRVIQSIEEVEDGAPALLTSDGKLYISGDIIEQAFSTFKSLGFFDSGQTTYTLAELPISDITTSDYHIGTWAEFVEFMDGEWASIKTFANAHHGTPDTRSRYYYDGRDYINAADSFTEYWANMRTVFADNNTAMGYMNAAESSGNKLYGYQVYMESGTAVTPYAMLIIYNVGRDFYTLDRYTASEYNRILDRTGRHRFNSYGEAFSFCKYYRYDDFYNEWRFSKISLRSFIASADGGYGSLTISRNIDPSAEGQVMEAGTFGSITGYSMGAWFVYTSKSAGGTVEGITQEDGATIPTNSDVSFTAWVASNLSALWNARLISVAPPTFNIAQHNQSWYNVMLPYSLGYNSELDGEEEEPSGGAITQQDETTITQQEENETAGIEDTGTNTEDFNAYYDAKEGSQKETQGQEDDGEVEEDTQETEDYKASGSTAIYVPTRAQLQSIFNWLWSDNFIENVKKYFQDPAEAMIGLYKCYMPFTPDGSATVVFGRVSSGVSAATTHKYHTWSSGAIQIQKFYNNYLDYKAECSIYIPFFGFNNIDLRDILGSTIEVKIKWEMMTGSALAELWVTRDNMSAPLYIWQGNVFESIPFSASNQSSYQLGVLSMLGKTASGAVSGMVASGGNPLAALGAGALGAAGGLAGLHNSQHVTQGGSITGNSGALGPKKPFITIRYPKDNTPVGFKQFDGNGTDTVGKIGSFSGFIKCREVRLNGIPGATSDSIENIRNLLLEGVYV